MKSIFLYQTHYVYTTSGSREIFEYISTLGKFSWINKEICPKIYELIYEG